MSWERRCAAPSVRPVCERTAQKARAAHSKAKYREGMLVVLLVVIAVLLLVPLVGAALWAVITAAILGLIIGGLARLVLPGQQRIGLGMTVLLGWVGSLIGGFVGYHVIHTGSLLTILLEIAAAALIIAVYAKTSPRTRTPIGSGRTAHWQ